MKLKWEIGERITLNPRVWQRNFDQAGAKFLGIQTVALNPAIFTTVAAALRWSMGPMLGNIQFVNFSLRFLTLLPNIHD